MPMQNTARSADKVMVNGDIVFTIMGGPIQVYSLHSELITLGDNTASTLQWQSTPTVGTATTISGATSALGSTPVPAAGATVILTPTALSTAPTIALASAGGVQLGLAAQNHIIVNAGTLNLVIGVGSTTSVWRHYLVYIPLAAGVMVF